MTQTIRTLMDSLIDYAGLFPPARLDMAPACENYARYLHSEHAWMLGRFICSASRLEELSTHGALSMPGTHATSGYREHATSLDPWRISTVIDIDLEPALDAIVAFNERHSNEDAGLAVCDTVEIRVHDPRAIDETIERLPEAIVPFFELDPSQDLRGLVAALAGDEACAKIRCGGVQPSMIPPAEHIAHFIDTCALAQVPFKATAGLHHPVRGQYPLTYDENPPRACMHGFLNVFLAAAFRIHDPSFDVDEMVSLLSETDPAQFVFEDESVRWRSHEMDLEALTHARRSFCLAYGSCSFAEPVNELREMGLLADSAPVA